MSKVNGSFPTGLDALLQRDARAKQYYSALPSYVPVSYTHLTLPTTERV